MLFKQTSKAKEEKLVINVVEGSLPIVENPKYLTITCVKKRQGGRKNKQTNKFGTFKKLKDQEQTGGLRRGG